MRWIWGSRCLKGDEVERDEKAKRCRNKKCKADIGALVGCRKAYPLGNGVEDDASASACRALEEKVIYCYAKQYCPEVSKAKQRLAMLAWTELVGWISCVVLVCGGLRALLPRCGQAPSVLREGHRREGLRRTTQKNEKVLVAVEGASL